MKINSRFIFRLVILFGLLFFLSLQFFKQSTIIDFHGDEFIFTQRAKFADWYASGSFFREEWRTFESYDVPKFAELFYGFVLRAYSNDSAVNYLVRKKLIHKDSLFTDIKNEELFSTCCTFHDLPKSVRDKTEVIIFLRHVVILVFVIPLLIFIFLIGYEAGGFSFGFISTLLVGTNSLFIYTMPKAMGDAQLWFFSFLFLLLTIYFSRFYTNNITNKRSTKFSLCVVLFLTILGLCGGLAIASKLNGILVLLFLIGYYLYQVFLKQIDLLIGIFHVLFVTLIAYCTFFVLNPFLWSNPISNTIFMAKHRENTFELQQGYFPSDRLTSFTERLGAVFTFTFSAESEYIFFKFDVLHDQKYLFPLDLVLVISSFVLLYANRKKHSEAFKIVMIFMSVIVVITTIFIPMKWERYFLPYMFSWGFLQAYVLTLIIQKLLSEDASAKK